jgi:hypothetical protein
MPNANDAAQDKMLSKPCVSMWRYFALRGRTTRYAVCERENYGQDQAQLELNKTKSKQP